VAYDEFVRATDKNGSGRDTVRATTEVRTSTERGRVAPQLSKATFFDWTHARRTNGLGTLKNGNFGTEFLTFFFCPFVNAIFARFWLARLLEHGLATHTHGKQRPRAVAQRWEIGDSSHGRGAAAVAARRLFRKADVKKCVRPFSRKRQLARHAATVRARRDPSTVFFSSRKTAYPKWRSRATHAHSLGAMREKHVFWGYGPITGTPTTRPRGKPSTASERARKSAGTMRQPGGGHAHGLGTVRKNAFLAPFCLTAHTTAPATTQPFELRQSRARFRNRLEKLLTRSDGPGLPPRTA